MRKRWKKFRYRLEYWGMRLLASAVPLLPRRACLILAQTMGELYYWCDAKTRGVALENLRLALGDSLTPKERERVARASFRNFARAILDLFWGRRVDAGNVSRYMKLEGFEEARKARDEQGGIVLAVLHYGSYEWMSIGTALAGLPVWIVAMDFKNPALEAVFGMARSHSGHHLINRRQSMLRLLRAARRNGGVGMLIDLALSLDHPGVIIDAFGMKMHVTFLHALLYERAHVPIVPVTNVPHADGTCTITAHPPLKFPPGATRKEITQACWDFYEPFIRARPDLWLWSYRHWRFKPENATEEYPGYAHCHWKFEQRLKDEGGDGENPS
jgi:lauroyl/myristoyl acyltransferase